MNIFLFFVFNIVGYIIGSFGIIQVLIILFFAMPLTNTLVRHDAVLDVKAIRTRFTTTILTWLAIISVVTYLIARFASTSSFYGYWVGIGLVLFLGRKRLGSSSANVQDYLNSYGDFLDGETILANPEIIQIKD